MRYNRDMSLPESLRPYFWNCKFEDLDTEIHKGAIIEQISEFGNIDAMRWMMQTFTEEDIRRILKQAKILSPHTRSFWSVFLHIDLSDGMASGNTSWHNRAQA